MEKIVKLNAKKMLFFFLLRKVDLMKKCKIIYAPEIEAQVGHFKQSAISGVDHFKHAKWTLCWQLVKQITDERSEFSDSTWAKLLGSSKC